MKIKLKLYLDDECLSAVQFDESHLTQKTIWNIAVQRLLSDIQRVSQDKSQLNLKLNHEIGI